MKKRKDDSVSNPHIRSLRETASVCTVSLTLVKKGQPFELLLYSTNKTTDLLEHVWW
jgi:hypothetical protein